MGHFPDGADSTWSATQGAKQWHGQNGYMFEDTAQGRGIQGCVVNCYGWVPDGKAIDVRADALVSITPQGDCGWFETFQYDAAGRQSQASATDNVGQYCIPHTGHSLARGFDAENHTVVQTSTAWPYWPWGIGGATTVALGYQWGPNGHPAMAGSSTTAPVSNWETLHWDGDTLLFASNASGQVDDVKVGMLADYTPLDANYRGLTVWDRELSGLWVGEHNTSGAGSGGDPDAYRRGTQCMAPGATSSGSYSGTTGFVGPKGFTGINVGQGGYMCSPAQDGYSDGYNVFQGVRAYDPQLQTWTTPDAYAGDVRDPASQKPYMYNKNNPFEYGDPTGFLVQITGSGTNDVTFTFFVRFYLDPSVRNSDKVAFIHNVEARLSGTVGSIRVTTRVVETRSTGPLVVTVHLENPALYPGGNPPALGAPGGNHVDVGTNYFGDRAHTSGAQAHEIFHTTYNTQWDENHTVGPGDIMNADFPTGTLSPVDIWKAENNPNNPGATPMVDDPSETGTGSQTAPAEM